MSIRWSPSSATRPSGFIQHRLLRAEPYVVRTEHVDDLFRIIQPSCVPSLSLMAMPAKDEATGDTQPLSSFAQRLAPLSSHFDLSLVDASHVDDLAVAAASAQAAIIAVRRDGTRTASLKSAIQKLSMLNTPLIGTVMLV
jgi:Mrp family chromosome partitioning ATPase